MAATAEEIMNLISCGKLDTGFLITHRMDFAHIMDAYDIFEKKKDHVIKIAIRY